MELNLSPAELSDLHTALTKLLACGDLAAAAWLSDTLPTPKVGFITIKSPERKALHQLLSALSR